MTIYVISLDQPSGSAWETVKAKWPDSYLHNDHIAFVQDDNKRLTSEIADDMGIGSDLSGMIIQLDYYSGFTSSPLVEWLGKNS